MDYTHRLHLTTTWPWCLTWWPQGQWMVGLPWTISLPTLVLNWCVDNSSSFPYKTTTHTETHKVTDATDHPPVHVQAAWIGCFDFSKTVHSLYHVRMNFSSTIQHTT